ncbi:alpha/beta fold hydrolase [Aliiglaciecola litoralis]|uniref:Serine aminopeptidase S33 domain-containing protein n=1 Tax=Aliiglaciecola litoralis TaxID=582857 RepID=A0ABP3WWK2_9ALTE
MYKEHNEEFAVKSQEKIQPLFIGFKEESLYGCHHEVLHTFKKATPIIICPPLAHEYERCHRALKQLASALAKAGFNVLRFDYVGTGDSAGHYEQVDFNNWRADTHRAIDFFKQRTGAQQVVLCGLRLGATIAHQVTLERRDVVGSVLWSPCLKGKQVVAHWRDVQIAHQQALGYDLKTDQITEVLGFPLSAKVQDQLHKLNLTQQKILTEIPKYHCIVDEQTHQWQSQQALLNLGHSFFIDSKGSRIWDQEAMEARVPMHIVHAMVSWLQGAFK